MEEKFKYFPKLMHGGDYNPDQWLDRPEILKEDIELMKKAHVNCVSLGIFAWSRLEPEEGKYDFDWLEEIIDNLYANGIYTILATPTAARPLWMTTKYPETRQMLSDGTRKLPGLRHNFCMSSPVMRQKMHEINAALSRHFGSKEAVIAWHISNEYGGGGGDHGDSACYCPYCQQKFRQWLKDKYVSLDNLNHAWWSDFWSNRVTDWEQINAPTSIGEFALGGLNLDWKKFTSDQYVDFCRDEISSVREFSHKPVTTNLMGFFLNIDYFKLARELDFVSIDTYPGWHTGDDIKMAMQAAIGYDLMRSLKKKEYFVMESVTSSVEWMPYNPLKRPGMHMLSSMQTIAHGSDSVCYFQWRKGRGSAEKYHGAVVDHKNAGDTRVFRDVTQLGERLEKDSSLIPGTCNQARVAMVYDWENVWAIQGTTNLVNPFPFADKWVPYYAAVWKNNVTIDIVNMDDSLDGYDLVIAPVNYMYRGDYMENVRRFVANGGTYLTTYYSGQTDESGLCFTGQHPLRDLLGIRTEEIDVKPDDVSNSIRFTDGEEYSIADRGICEIVHAENAQVLASYTSDFYAGFPGLTVNGFGNGRAYFLAAEGQQDLIDRLIGQLLQEKGISSSFKSEKEFGISVCDRLTGDGQHLIFVMNFHACEKTVSLQKSYIDAETGELYRDRINMQSYEVKILKA